MNPIEARWRAGRARLLGLLLAVIVIGTAGGAGAAEETNAALRARFLEAEAALAQADRARADALWRQLAAADYPLAPYLRHQLLGDALGLSQRQAVREFLAAHPDLPLARRLRARWLATLAAAEAWPLLLADYAPMRDAASQCRYHYAQWQTGQQDAASEGARSLWLSGRSQPNACDPLFAAWRASEAFEPALVWDRLVLAVASGATGLVRFLEAELPPTDQPLGALWRAARSQPTRLVTDPRLQPTAGERARQLAQIRADVAMRLVRADPTYAASHWPQLAAQLVDPAPIRHELAIRLLLQGADNAGRFADAVPPAQRDEALIGWQLRWALARADWPYLLRALEALDVETAGQAQWAYWRGRALAKLGRADEARAAFQRAASQREFHGLLAADRLGRPYALEHRPLAVSEADMAALLREVPAFARMNELAWLARETELRAEWFAVIGTLPAAQVPAAATLAERWGQHALGISALARIGAWDDLDRRFPLPFRPLVANSADRAALEPSLIYAIARRESAMNPRAVSPAGAIGLMQLMPATGKAVAGRQGEVLPTPALLREPARNLRYGSAYLRELIDRYGGHLPMAIAAYNAGPGRVAQWRPVNAPVPADIWIETLPYRETRGYVQAVLLYETIYRWRLGQPAERVSRLLEAVGPETPTRAANEG